MIARLRRTYNHLIRSLMNRLLITTMKHPTTNPSFFFLGSVLKKSTPGKFTPIWYLKPVGILFRDKVFAAIAVFVKPKLPHIRRATSHKSSGHAGEQEQKQSFLNSFFMQIIPKNIVPPTWPLCRVVETSNKPRLQVFGYKVILYFIYVAKDKQNYQTSRRIF